MFSQYKQETAKYGKKDAFIALGFYAYVCGILFIFGILGTQPNMPIGVAAQTVLSTSLIIIPFFALIILRKQSIASIGIHTKNLWPALRIGLVLCTIILLITVFTPAFMGEWELYPIRHIMIMFALVFLVVFMEDTLFTGYLQTRIYGLIKNDIVAVMVIAFLFAFSHVVTIVGIEGISGFNTIITGSMWFWFLMHVTWNLIFRRYFSLLPITMFHIAWNFANSGIFAASYGRYIGVGAFGGGTIEKYVMLLVVVIWLVFSYFKARKG